MSCGHTGLCGFSKHNSTIVNGAHVSHPCTLSIALPKASSRSEFQIYHTDQDCYLLVSPSLLSASIAMPDVRRPRGGVSPSLSSRVMLTSHSLGGATTATYDDTNGRDQRHKANKNRKITANERCIGPGRDEHQ
jgi:hypothetical protein